MNNKKLGTDFENEFCDLLAKLGFWVHFITPDKAGSQPFDVIAVKNGKAYAFDCKTSSRKFFKKERLEENQKTAFDKWLRCGNANAYIAVKYEEHIYLLPYADFIKKHDGRVNLEQYEVYRWK